MPAAIPIATLAISAGTSIYQTSQANKAAKKAARQIEEYDRQDLANPYQNMQISTEGADRQRQDLARTMATYANYAAQGGGRAIAALTPQMIAQQNAQEAQIVANLDQQEAARQQAIAQGSAMVQGMVEQRENADLAGLGNMYNVARQERMNGINNLVQTGMSAASMGLEMNRQGMFSGIGGQGINTTPQPLQTIQAGLNTSGWGINSSPTQLPNPYAINPLTPWIG